MDLSSFINKSGCECLNDSDENPLAHSLTSKGGYLESDCDEQVSSSSLLLLKVKFISLYDNKLITLWMNLLIYYN
jgi:hypothetical protein